MYHGVLEWVKRMCLQNQSTNKLHCAVFKSLGKYLFSLYSLGLEWSCFKDPGCPILRKMLSFLFRNRAKNAYLGQNLSLNIWDCCSSIQRIVLYLQAVYWSIWWSTQNQQDIVSLKATEIQPAAGKQDLPYCLQPSHFCGLKEMRSFSSRPILFCCVYLDIYLNLLQSSLAYMWMLMEDTDGTS